MDNNQLPTNITNLTATVTDARDFPNSLKAIVSGQALEMNVNAFVTLELEEYEALEVIEFYSACGYAKYKTDVLPNHEFYANIDFEREGTDWIPLELESPSLEIETLEKQTQ